MIRARFRTLASLCSLVSVDLILGCASQMWHINFVTVVHQSLTALFHVIFLLLHPVSLPKTPFEPFRPKTAKFPVNDDINLRRSYVVLPQIVMAKKGTLPPASAVASNYWTSPASHESEPPLQLNLVPCSPGTCSQVPGTQVLAPPPPSPIEVAAVRCTCPLFPGSPTCPFTSSACLAFSLNALLLSDDSTSLEFPMVMQLHPPTASR